MTPLQSRLLICFGVLCSVLLGFALQPIGVLIGGWLLLDPIRPYLGYAAFMAPMIVTGWYVLALVWGGWENPAAKMTVASAPALIGMLLLVSTVIVRGEAVGNLSADLIANFWTLARKSVLIAAGPAIVAGLSLLAMPMTGHLKAATKVWAAVPPVAAAALTTLVGVACQER